MGKGKEEVEIAFNLEVESRRAIKGLTAVDNTLKKIFGRELDLGDSFDSKSVKAFRKELGGSKNDLKELETAFKHSKFDAGFKSNFDSIKKEHRKLQKVLTDGEAAIAAAAATGDKKKEAEVRKHWAKHTVEAQKGLKREQKILRKLTGREEVGQHLKKRTLMTKYAKGENVGREATETQKNVAEAITSGFSSLSGKDLLGVGKAGAKLSSILAHGLGKKSIAVGDKLQNTKKKGMLGGAMKMAGGVMKSGGGAMAALAEMGPMLGLIGGAIASLVKLLVDVQAKAKEMNKAMLEGVATSSYMSSNFGSADLAAANLESTLNDVRVQATDVAANIKYGTNADDIMKAANAYGQQGMALNMINDSLERGKKAGDASAKSIGDFGTMARISFGYSKMLGVSFQEITDFQGELFTEMGSSVGDLRLELARMTRDAGDSGIAANKFFGILRGVSADLSLYTTRLGQASSALKLIGKAMSSKEAGKFLSTLSTGYKQMSEGDRIKRALLMDPKKREEIVNKDIASKMTHFYQQVLKATEGTGTTLDEIKAASELSEKDSGKALEGILNRTEAGKKQMGTFMGTNSELMMDKNAMKGTGPLGAAEAMSNLSVGASFDAEVAAWEHFGGKGRIGAVTGLKGVGARQSMGWDAEKQRGMAKMQDSVARERGSMKTDLSALQGKKESDLSVAEKARLSSLKDAGLTSNDAIDKASAGDIINALAGSDKQILGEAEEQKKLQEKTANLTRGIMELSQLAIDGIFEQIYQVMLDISDTLSKSLDPIVKALEPLGKLLGDKSSGMSVGKVVGGALGVTGTHSGSSSSGAQAVTGALGVSTASKVANAASSMLGSTLNAVGLTKATPPVAGPAAPPGAAYGPPAPPTAEASTAPVARSRSRGRPPGSGPTAAQKILAAAGTTPPTTGAPPTPPAAQAYEAERKAEGGPMAGTPMTEKDILDRIDITGKNTVKNLQDLWTLMSATGIRINKSHLGTDVEPVIKKGVLEGVREALFEQAVYSSSNPTALLEKMSNSGFGGVSSLAQSYKPAAAHAAGGAVTGVANGMAVFAPPGEGLTSIGPGERIVPSNAGGGGSAGAIHLHVNGLGGADLAAYLKGKVAEGVYEYKRKEKF